MLKKILCGAFSAAFICSLSAVAMACRGPDLETTIFFDEVPADIRADVVAQITVTKLIGTAASAFTKAGDDRFSFSGIAHVDRIIKGNITGETIKIRAPNTTCDHPFSVGSTGIVVGSFRTDAKGSIELVVTAESAADRRKRKNLQTVK